MVPVYLVCFTRYFLLGVSCELNSRSGQKKCAVTLIPPVFFGMGTQPCPLEACWLGERTGDKQGLPPRNPEYLLTCPGCRGFLPAAARFAVPLRVGQSSTLTSCFLVSTQAHYRIEPARTWAQGVDGPRDGLSGTCEWVYVFSPGNQELMVERSTNHHLRYWRVSGRPVLQACQRR